MQNDDYTQSRSATKRHSKNKGHFQGDIETQPQMIHLFNLNPVTNESFIDGDVSKIDGQNPFQNQEVEFAIYGDDDEVEDPEIDLAQVRFGAGDTTRNSARMSEKVSELRMSHVKGFSSQIYENEARVSESSVIDDMVNVGIESPRSSSKYLI